MSSRTITSVYQTRKRRYQDPMGEAVRPKCKQLTKVAIPSASHSKSQSPSPVAVSPKVRQSVRDTSMRFLCSQSDSQPEISWNCNSPEFHKPVSRWRDLENNANNNDMLCLIHNTFDVTTSVKNEEKKNSLLAIWRAPAEGNISQFPQGVPSTSTGHKTQPVKPHLEKEFEQLIAKAARPRPVNSLPTPAAESVNDPDRLKVVNAPPVTSSEANRENNVNTRVNPTLNLDNEIKCAVRKTVVKTQADANSFDAWSDEDLFNDEGFIEQTQKLMTAYVELSNSQAPTQKLFIPEDTIESDDDLLDITPINAPIKLQEVTIESDDDLLDITTINAPIKLQEVTSTGSQFTALNAFPAVIPAVRLSKLIPPLQEKTEQKNVNLDEFWDCDDGIDEIMCTIGDVQNKEDSLDYLMNCETQPYPATNQESSPFDSFTTLIPPTQVLDENVTKLHGSMQKSPWKLNLVSAKGNSNTVNKTGPVKLESSCEVITGPNRPSVPSKTLLRNPSSSKIMPPGASSKHCTTEEIERKKQEALEKRRQKMEQSKLSKKCHVIYSQIMPATKK